MSYYLFSDFITALNVMFFSVAEEGKGNGLEKC
jgi:hypothetical protein